MNIFGKITLQSLKKNKTRTLVTIIGVILSAALLTAVMTSAGSFLYYLKDNTLYLEGNWHGRIPDAESTLAEKLSGSEEVGEFTTLEQLGYAEAENAYDKTRPYFYLLGTDQEAPSFLPIHMITGKYPAAADELILPDTTRRDSGIALAIGDTLTLKLGDRICDGEKLGQDDPVGRHTETLQVRENRSYRITGFYEILGQPFENYNSPGMTAFTLADSAPGENTACDIYFRLHKPQNFSKIIQAEGFPIPAEKIQKNTSLLMFYGEAPFANFYKMLYSMVAIVTALIIFGSTALIYNAFSISVSERIRQFGLLSSIGATRKQLGRTVLFEALAIGAAGIPAGILLGIGGIGITFLLIGEKFRALGFHAALRLHLSPVHLLAACVFALLTVLISAWLPALRASKVSAMEAIRQNTDVKEGNKALKTSPLVMKLFGLPGVLARKYYKRSQKKYRTTVFSLFMSILLFISAFSFTDYMVESVDGGLGTAEYDLSMWYSPYIAENIPEEQLLQKVQALDSVESTAIIREVFCDLKIDESEVTDKILNERNIWTKNNLPNSPYLKVSSILMLVDDASFRKLLQENGLSEAEYFDSARPLGIAVDGKAVYNGQTQRYEKVTYLKRNRPEFKTEQHRPLAGFWFEGVTEDEAGHELARYRKDDGEDGGSENPEYRYLPAEEMIFDRTLSIGAVLDTPPYYCHDTTPLTLIYPVSRSAELVSDYTPALNPCRFIIMAEDHQTADSDIRTLIEENNLIADSILDRAADEENLRSTVLIVRVFAYGFIILISLIAAANVFNTISTNLNLRRREFAMLKSIGMTEREFRRMMHVECLLYGTKSLLYGLPAACLVTFLIWKSTGFGYETTFRLPLAAMGIAVCSVFAVVFAAMLYTMQKIRQENLIDALRNENI